MPFDQRLVLNRYILGLFGAASFEELAKGLTEPEYEGWDEDNVSQMYHVLAARVRRFAGSIPDAPAPDDLLRYDANIVSHTIRISGRRPQRIHWRYFQYLALLVTEIYLDRYFSGPAKLLGKLNDFVAKFNDGLPAADRIQPYTRDDLRKLAFWMATGSGKTLLMHVNILQYRHYLHRSSAPDALNRIILLTPNEGLSAQHLAELDASGIPARLFQKDAGKVFGAEMVEVIDIHKLAEEMGEKTVAVEAFEGNNLVLVDEGHRGVGGEDWKGKRDRLCAEGFSFEYSATFGQAVRAAVGARRKAIEQEYARCILFDYSYKYFYTDGYGKDYQILNLAEDDAETQHLYLVAGLLSFYQQRLAWEEHRLPFAPYGVERPLWVFVGGSVTKTLSTRESSDVIAILRFFARFLDGGAESVELLDRLLSGNTGLTFKGRDVFAGKFGYLMVQGVRGEELYRSMLARVFNAGGGRLHIEELKGAVGELALRVGGSEPFGVINVGDAHALAKKCAEYEDLTVTEREFSGSLFGHLNDSDSRIHLLIGSKKFTEGWNSWRVSSMGLMNVGKGEGAQIIQMFGRGVRLRGLGGSLKRSTAIPGVKHPGDLDLLETLNVFGVRADYMAQFREYLDAEGVPSTEKDEIALPVIQDVPVGRLKSIRLRGGGEFRRDAPKPLLGPPPEAFRTRRIPLDWYPKLEALESKALRGRALGEVRHVGKLAKQHLAFLDLDAIHQEIVCYKRERGWDSLIILRDVLWALLGDSSWYTLEIPEQELRFGGPEPLRRTRMWQEIAVSLLKKYVERYYKAKREEWEATRRETYVLDGTDPNFFAEYRFEVAREHADTILETLRKIREAIEKGELKDWEFGSLDVFSFDRHLYSPLVHLGNKDVSVKPVALNEDERNFVKDLRQCWENRSDLFSGTELYLLRNMTRSKGVGFFEGGNFYPDFILWLLREGHQHVTFIDPKGIRNLAGAGDPKIAFYQTIKGVERQLGDPDITLNSFILANTLFAEVSHWLPNKEAFTERHVLFQADDRDSYIETMVRMITDTSVGA
jgi:Type III restriction enzyme, res subunit